MKHIVYLIASLIISLNLKAQADIKIDKREETRIKALAKKVIVDGLNDLLNNIANKETESSDIDQIITQSYTEGRSKIFFDQDKIIEDDINPTHNSKINSSDAPVKKYLKDFDQYYIKGMDKSVIFSEVRDSHIKLSKGKDKYIYVNVYFNSVFKSKNNSFDQEYGVNRRVAEVRMEKKDKWTGYINSILFYSPDDTLNDFADDIIIDNTQAFAGASPSDSTRMVDSTNILAQIEADELNLIKKQAEDEDNRYNEIVEKGDKAGVKNDLTSAKAYYKEALDLRPHDRNVRKKLNRVVSEETAAQYTTEKKYKDFLHKAGSEEKKRNFMEAKKWYVKALDTNIKDGNTSNYEAKIKELDKKWQAVFVLNEKFKTGNDYKTLIDDYNDAIKKNKENSDLYLGRGKCYDLLVNLPKALKDYDKAIELDPMNLPAIKLRAELKVKTGDLYNAIGDYGNYLTLDDEDLSIYEVLSELKMRIKADNYDDAIKILNEGIEKNAEWTPFYYKRGLLLAQKNDHREAIKSFTQALKYNSSHALAYYHRGKSHLATNNVKSAAPDFDNARKNGLDSTNKTNIASYAKVFYDRSVKHFDVSNRDSAKILIDYAIDLDPLNPEYHFKKGEYFYYQGRNDDAISSLSRAITYNKDLTEAYHKRGLTYYNMKKYADAVTNQKSVLSLNPSHYGAKKNLADAYFAQKDFGNAALYYEGYITTTSQLKVVDPTTLPVVYNSLGKSYFIMNETDDRALTAFKNAIKKNENYAEAYFNRGKYYHKKGDLSNAIDDMMKAISLDPKQPEWNYQLGLAYTDKGDYQNAKNNFITTISLDSLKNYPKALYLSANSAYMLQDYPGALSGYLQVKNSKRDAGINQFNYELGSIYLRSNNPDSALVFLQKAFVKDSANSYVAFGIATAYHLKGNTEDAFTWFEKAFQTGQLKEKMIKNDKQLVALKDDKRFKSLIKKYY